MSEARPDAPHGGRIDVLRAAHRRALWIAVALALATALTVVFSMRHTSVTFDETFMIPSGARGYDVGRFDMTLDHPPVTQYLYGLPVHLDGARAPEEAPGRWGMHNRFTYGTEFLFESGNDPERVVFLARLMAAAMAGLLVLVVFRITAGIAGRAAALVAAFLVAFLPDVLAHGGIAYNDVPLALAFLAALWAIDAAARRPSLPRTAGAAALVGLALGVKFSALALAPAVVLILAMEGWIRRGDRRWWLAVGRGVAVGAVVLYATLVLVYLGDFTLADFRWGITSNIAHASQGHGVPAFLLGEGSLTGFWYFYPVVFFLKTPVALHVLAAIAVIGALAAPRLPNDRLRRWLTSPLRPIVIGALVFLAFLLKANLNIGFRHAMPLLPLVCILVAVGVVRAMRWVPRLRPWIALLLLVHALETLSFYPHFLTFTSAYAPDRDAAGDLFVDSTLDWGQGLLELREWMERRNVDRIYLSYFGSALPEGYGIDYVALRSFFRLSGTAPAFEPRAASPEWVVISATNRIGSYLPGDPFVEFRQHAPAFVLAHHLYVYPVASWDTTASSREP
ncbi:MAG TPA: glycosyltransferase family 39 protein [Longimicrobiales bacterium]|nr:glycosyltransferase family 39 protein [Longimicrobiales bacterium]